MSSKQSDFYKSYMETLQKKAKEAVSKAQEKTFEEYFEVADTKIRDIYKKTIIDFYQDYTPPRFYDRRGSLFNLIQTKRGSDYLSIWFDPSKISYRNGYAGEDGLYETVLDKVGMVVLWFMVLCYIRLENMKMESREHMMVLTKMDIINRMKMKIISIVGR